jgi:hypothetical protein
MQLSVGMEGDGGPACEARIDALPGDFLDQPLGLGDDVREDR